MKTSFAAALLLGSAIASLTREQIAKLQKTQMQSCVNRVDFLDKDSMRQIEECATYAKQAISRNRADKPSMPYARTNLGPGSQLVPGLNISGAPHPVALPVMTPGDNCCIFYDGNLSGDYAEFCHNGELYEIDLTGHQLNDRITSYSCGEHVHVQLCVTDCETDWDMHNMQQHVGKGMNHFNTQPWYDLFDNDVTQIKLRPYNEDLLGAVNLYAAADCLAAVTALFYMDQADGGQYLHEDIYTSGLGYYAAQDRSISSTPREAYMIRSLQVPAGYQVTLFKGEFFNGESMTFTSRTYADSEKCQVSGSENVFSWNSLIIDRIPHSQAIGYWKSITSGETTSFTYTVGITSSSSQQVTHDSSYEFTASLTAGISFAGYGGVSSTISSTNRQSETTSVMSQYGMSTTSVTATSCTAEGNEGAGLWQWVVATEDYSFQAMSDHTVCRTGDIYNVAPACPWFACIGGDCAECRPSSEW